MAAKGDDHQKVKKSGNNDNGDPFWNENDYDDLYDALQQLLVKSSKLDTAHRKLKSDFKDLQSKYEKSLLKKKF